MSSFWNNTRKFNESFEVKASYDRDAKVIFSEICEKDVCTLPKLGFCNACSKYVSLRYGYLMVINPQNVVFDYSSEQDQVTSVHQKVLQKLSINNDHIDDSDRETVRLRTAIPSLPATHCNLIHCNDPQAHNHVCRVTNTIGCPDPRAHSHVCVTPCPDPEHHNLPACPDQNAHNVRNPNVCERDHIDDPEPSRMLENISSELDRFEAENKRLKVRISELEREKSEHIQRQRSPTSSNFEPERFQELIMHLKHMESENMKTQSYIDWKVLQVYDNIKFQLEPKNIWVHQDKIDEIYPPREKQVLKQFLLSRDSSRPVSPSTSTQSGTTSRRSALTQERTLHSPSASLERLPSPKPRLIPSQPVGLFGRPSVSSLFGTPKPRKPSMVDIFGKSSIIDIESPTFEPLPAFIPTPGTPLFASDTELAEARELPDDLISSSQTDYQFSFTDKGKGREID